MQFTTAPAQWYGRTSPAMLAAKFRVLKKRTNKHRMKKVFGKMRAKASRTNARRRIANPGYRRMFFRRR